jgi:hypothetical protein
MTQRAENKMSLKSKNMPALVAFAIAQAVLHLFVLGLLDAGAVKDAWAAMGRWDVAGGATLAVALVVAMVAVLTDLLSDEMKARLVFWRWRNPLPGCRAFSEHMLRDDRIDAARLQAAHGELPSDPTKQNALWFAIYRKHRGAVSVSQSHARYLLLREMAVLCAVLALAFLVAAVFLLKTPGRAYGLALLLQYVVIARAARNAGVRLVKNVLAEEGSEGAA